MKPSYYLIIVIAIGALLLVLRGLLFPQSNDVGQVTTFPDSGEVQERAPVERALVLMQTKDDVGLPSRNFLEDADTYELSDDGIYIIGERSEAIIGEQFKIFYDEVDGSIIVSLLALPLAPARLFAEEELLLSTGLTEARLCEAKIIVNASRYVSPTYAGRDLGLSFCPGSVALE